MELVSPKREKSSEPKWTRQEEKDALTYKRKKQGRSGEARLREKGGNGRIGRWRTSINEIERERGTGGGGAYGSKIARSMVLEGEKKETSVHTLRGEKKRSVIKYMHGPEGQKRNPRT